MNLRQKLHVEAIGRAKKELPGDIRSSSSTNDDEINGNENGISSTMAVLEQLL